MLRVLSLGAGVQSTCVALMAAYGDIEPIDVAIFADTGWEPAEVYEHLGRLEAELGRYDVPVHRVSAGDIRSDHLTPDPEQSPHLFIRNPRSHPEWLGRQRVFVPLFTLTPEGGKGVLLGDEVERESGEVSYRKGRTRRTCTKTYKIEPVEKEIRRLLGLKPRQRWPVEPSVSEVFGISWDESQRIADPTRPCIVHDYPLIDRRMTRDDCHQWMADHGWTAPRSACVGCPFHRNDEWRRIRDDSPEEFEEAIVFDRQLRQLQADGRLCLDGIPFIHDSRVPLDQADLGDRDGTGFGADCGGFCGT